MRDDAGEGQAVSPPREILRHPAFAYFWSATTIRAFGGAIAGVAFQVVIVNVLDATPVQISVLSSLGVVPYLFLGLIVGAFMDRWRRQRTLVATTVGRAILLAGVPVLLLTSTLSFWTLGAVILALGVLTLFAESAAQPLLPRIVPRASLVSANARLGQSGTVASTAGPALGGALLKLVGPSLLFIIEAVINAIAAVLQARIRITEPKAEPRQPGRHVGHDIVEGTRYVYRHPTLRPLALSVHAWFLGNSIVVTVFAVYVLRSLSLSEWAYGLALAAGGIGGFAGAVIAPRIGAWLGAGGGILLGRVFAIVPWVVLAVVPLSDRSETALTLSIVASAQFIYGLAMGIEDTNDISYRQAIAHDEIQGRMNATIRTVNRVVFFFGALLTGVLMTLLGYRWTLAAAAVAFSVAALVILSPLRSARHEDVAD
ncbi:MFS transporter [Microbacterium horticulturae]|uniref:MFS transporter n=1 Tax=Microbacterium horticulturae TaxID=3028316 RepID=A0ABY8C278_9MICO|nr:MFS transporter [Microbacterium sp. KACC 23027]WEG10559.1 MFS transporter [Microbacterium sp. KACC 23027]